MTRVNIISSSGEPFRDRQAAGQLLAQELESLRGQNTVVLGIPRGGVVVAREIARALGAELDIVLARKLRSPGHPELALGSVAENGKIFLNRIVVSELDVEPEYIQQEKNFQLVEIVRRRELIRQVRPKVTLTDKTVIVTDDGVATGATIQAALWAVRQEKPRELIAAIPVGAPETVKILGQDADEIVCLRAPSLFAAVGQFYLHFGQVEDDDVVNILKEEYERQKQKISQ